jgi:predicted Rossmann fold flavoprotein
MLDSADIVIVGAGAAGLAAAIFAGEAAAASGTPWRVVLLDGAKKIGAKILVAGGGRCNVTHDRIVAADYQGPRNTVNKILRSFDERAAVRWFAAMGVELKREETGKLFPVTDDANMVLAALLRRCKELGVELLTDHRVEDVLPPLPPGEGWGEGDNHVRPAMNPVGIAPEDRDRRSRLYEVRHSRGALVAPRVVLATGGKSLPKTGSDGGAYAILQRLGHTVTATYPALVPLVLAEGFFHAALSGVSHEAELSTHVDGKRIDQRRGSLLWTHFGVSGPLAMDASRFFTIALGEGRAVEMKLGFLPGETFETVERWLIEAGRKSPKRSVTAILAERLPRRIAEVLVGEHGLAAPPGTPRPGLPAEIGQLPREGRRALVHSLTALPLPVLHDRGWNYAEVTAGGVPLSEIDPRTMESRTHPGLHLIGELLDVDGRIGGFNFQWAWATGHLAGLAAGDEVKP